jgi:hypothetical protein
VDDPRVLMSNLVQYHERGGAIESSVVRLGLCLASIWGNGREESMRKRIAVHRA